VLHTFPLENFARYIVVSTAALEDPKNMNYKPMSCEQKIGFAFASLKRI